MNARATTLPGRAAAERTILTRMGRNLGWLLGGRGFQAVASLFYLGLAARTLGPEGFGGFTLVLAYGQAIASLAQFQSWQTVIRYGAFHRANQNLRRLRRLLGLTVAMDGLGTLAGTIVAAGGAMVIRPWLGWSGQQQAEAILLTAVLLLSLGATPAGILRLNDRFDLLTYVQSIGPAIRTSGALLGWFLGFGVEAFLAFWAGGALLQGMASWTVALGLVGPNPILGRRAILMAARENKQVVRFMLVTNVNSTLSALPEQMGILAVGGFDGAATAGGYRLAAKLAKSVARPIQMLTVVIFPELARLTAEKDHATMAKLVRRANRSATILAVCFLVVVAVGGEPLLRLLSGTTYPNAWLLLFVLAFASAMDLSGVALDPVLTACGRADRVLAARAGAAIVFLILIAVLVPFQGPLGAVLAGVGSSAWARIRLEMAVRTVARTSLHAGMKKAG